MQPNMSSTETEYEPNGLPLAGGVKPVVDDVDSSYTSSSPSFYTFERMMEEERKQRKLYSEYTAKVKKENEMVDNEREESLAGDNSGGPEEDTDTEEKVCPSMHLPKKCMILTLNKRPCTQHNEDDEPESGCAGGIFYYKFPGSNHTVVARKAHKNWVIEFKIDGKVQSWFMLENV